MRLAGLAFAVVLAATAAAQPGAMIRGRVLDESGKPLPDVQAEMQFQGGGDLKPQTFTAKTDQRGYYARVGLPSGRYKIILSKSGYQTRGVEITISMGGLSEVPQEVLTKAPTAPAAGAPGAPPAPGVPTGAAAETANAIKAAFAKASEAAKEGKYDEAEALYKEILTKLPDFAPAHFNLGYVYRAKKELPAAEASFQKAVALEPTRPEMWVALAGTYRAMNDAQKALEVLIKGAPHFENDGSYLYELGIGYLNAGKNDEAVAMLKKAESITPGNIEIQFYLGTLAVARNDLAEAAARLEKYVAGTNQNARNLETAKGILKTIKK